MTRSRNHELLQRAERVATWAESPGCTAWASQVAPLIRQLAAALEREESRPPDPHGHLRHALPPLAQLQPQQPGLFSGSDA